MGVSRIAALLRILGCVAAVAWPIPAEAVAPDILWTMGGSSAGPPSGPRTPLGVPSSAVTLGFSLMSNVVAAADGDGRAWVWATATGRLVAAAPRDTVPTGASYDDEHPRCSFALAPDGASLFAGDPTGAHSLRQLRIADWSVVRVFDGGPSGGALQLTASADGLIASASAASDSVSVWSTSDGRLLKTLHGAGLAPVFCPGKGFLATASSSDGSVSLWRTSDWSLEWTIRPQDLGCLPASFSEDGSTLLLARSGSLAGDEADAVAELRRTSDGGLIKTLRPPAVGTSTYQRTADRSYAEQMALSPDGSTVAVAVSTGNGPGAPGDVVELWDVASGGLTATLAGHNNDVDLVTFSRDGSLLASAAEDGTVRVWRASDRKLLYVLPTEDGQGRLSVGAMAFSPDSLKLAALEIPPAGGASGPEPVVDVLDAATGVSVGQARWTWNPASLPPGPGVLLPFLSGDGYCTLMGTSPGAPATLAWVSPLWAQAGALPNLGTDLAGGAASSADGSYIAVGGGSIAVWGLRGQPSAARLDGFPPASAVVAFSPRGDIVAAAAAPAIATGPLPPGGAPPAPGLRLWEVGSWRELRTISGSPVLALDMAISPDATVVATADTDGQTRLWRVSDGTLLRTLPGANCVAFSPDGQLIATGGRLTLWRTSDGTIVRQYDDGIGRGVLDVGFSPDGRLMAYLAMQDGYTELVVANAPVAHVPVRGDVSDDGLVTIGDAMLVLRFVLGLTQPTSGQYQAADVDADGSLTVGDALAILRMALGLA